MEKIIGKIGIALIIASTFGLASCSSVSAYNIGKYESKSVGEIQYATIDSEFSTAIDTKEKAYKEADVLGLFLNVGVERGHMNSFGTLDGVKTIVLINRVNRFRDVLQKELEIIAQEITNSSYKFKVIVDNQYSYTSGRVWGKGIGDSFSKELKKGVFPIIIEENLLQNTGNYDSVGLVCKNFFFYDNGEITEKDNGILSNDTKSTIRHEIYHCLGISHYTYSFDENGAKNGRMINSLPKFSKMNVMAYPDTWEVGLRNCYNSNPDDIKVVELFSTIVPLENKILKNTCLEQNQLTGYAPKLRIDDIVQIRILDKYGIFINGNGRKTELKKDKSMNYLDIDTLKEKAVKERGTDNFASATLTTFMMNKVGCNVIDRMFAEKKTIGEIIDYAEKYYNLELISAIDIYLEAKLVKYFNESSHKVESLTKTYPFYTITSNSVFSRDDFDARLKMKYQRELSTSKEIFSSLREMLKAKGVI